MNEEPAYQAADDIWGSMRPLLDRLLAAPRGPRAQSKVPSVPGIYLFSDGQRYRYVGQTRNLRARLAQHTRPSGTHFSATLAFLMGVERAKEAGIPITGRQRVQLQNDPDFAVHFMATKAEVASWDVQFIELADPLVRTIFEVYVHVALATDLNSFETH
ncbi:hypothetical protein [Candidatus Amarobacter glycogenicus]|uniref:hypothetical protein n=1 Tax=Candidatus Amarobacter glycogenicus TaxID=3140699 RepID=UPI002A0BD2AD|nr:hypothetical protein [Dehalococcoidia bacterium]